MAKFMLLISWTDQGIRSIKDFAKRSQKAEDLAKKFGVEIKHVYLTSGETDLVVFVDAPDGDNMAKFALALGAQGNVRTRTSRVWAQEQLVQFLSELP
jgi:uncharacterized protein with GYD domain